MTLKRRRLKKEIVNRRNYQFYKKLLIHKTKRGFYDRHNHHNILGERHGSIGTSGNAAQ